MKTAQIERVSCLLARILFGITTLLPTASALAAPLDIADQPLFVTNSAKPNVILAVDDSGSMDFELLFGTDGGTLWWNRNTRSFSDSNGNLYSPPRDQQGSYYNYTYLFPNNCNGNGARDRRAYCSNSDYFAIPPIPQFAFARSPDFNQSYFDPSVTYKPWVGYDDADPDDAYADPARAGDRFDLTDDVRENDTYESFVIGPNMLLPAGLIIDAGGGWYRLNGNATVDNYRYLAIEYFPATFYLESPLPADFGYSADPLTGEAPDGSDMYGYAIRPGNFATGAHYEAMIQNFANWFSYYRKRHLATRGGIAGAFDQVSGFNVGACTINQTGSQDSGSLNYFDVTIRDLDSERGTFIDSILDIDFSQPQGTPNRHALHFLGEQFARNEQVITEACQQNFGILFTDGYTGDRNYTAGVDNADGGQGSPFADSKSNTLGDTAMYYYRELADRLAGRFETGKVAVAPGCDQPDPDPWLDCNADLHMVTFAVTLGQQGTIFGTDEQATDDPYANPPNWDDLSLSTYGPGQVDDLWHATINGRGTLLNANTPQEVADNFASTLNEISGRRGAASSLAQTSRNVSGDTRLFRATFVPGLWTGDLIAASISDGTGNGSCSVDDTIGQVCPDAWSASAQLETLAPNARQILTSDGAGQGVPFRASSLEVGTGEDAIMTPEELAYLRGDRNNERKNNGPFRNRSALLGDIVHSSPSYVGAPNRLRYPLDWDDLRQDGNENTIEDQLTLPYRHLTNNDFVQTYANRTPMVYVGANDGMLHGFRAADGVEQFAFIPGELLPDPSDDDKSSILDLSRPGYDQRHRYFVDGNPIVVDAVITRNGANAWRTVLVSGMRNGGRSVFALDVTDPSALTESNASDVLLWEFRDPDLGKSFSEPSIVRLHNGRWAAVFGNGYNSAQESAVLFVVDLSDGSLIRKIDTGATPSDETPDFGNGLSSVFPVDLDGDFVTDYFYAGDLYGNVWKFDLTASDAASWAIGFSGDPLFTARDSAGQRQPITTEPQVGIHPYGRGYGVMVYVGTGKYLEFGDKAANTSITHSVYGLWDLDVFAFTDDPPFTTNTKRIPGRTRLTRQSVLEGTALGDGGQSFRGVTQAVVQYQDGNDDAESTQGGSDRRGWVLDLPTASGELIKDKPGLLGRVLTFSTHIPEDDVCAAGGNGSVFLIDAATGGRTPFSALDVNGDFLFTRADRVTLNGDLIRPSAIVLNAVPGELSSGIVRGEAASNANVPAFDNAIIPLNDGTTFSQAINPGYEADGRRSWRELRR
ncbi:PilC/PilY family type IV pilus protein [Salinisphaera sp. P385]|uniref:PilC/PilY family type IV pilus protein n=1 Tax=Spectribacter acetivorans TaxID=3075603 RepID=A0ABU3B523_9GAMM|nr:PilC/PilY family type IV pilus protein [Salinisphaera sp. P385]MDT0617309.1 PilC/PilY family type IV pilus protein [Salinisphaera sp. P385]